LIIQYLNNEGLNQSATTLLNEKQNQLSSEQKMLNTIKSIFENIQSGDWSEVERLITSPISIETTATNNNNNTSPSTTTSTTSTEENNTKLTKCRTLFHKYNQSAFLYEIYKQQYLEMIDNGEMQKAFTFLTKKLKPLKAMQSNENEFKDLCYLLTCKSVQEVESFRNWDGPLISRDKLMEKLKKNFHLEDKEVDTSFDIQNVPSDRLKALLHQAAAYQVERKSHLSVVPPRVSTLLSDYETFVIPQKLKYELVGHMENVKCIQFLGSTQYLASGSSDNTVRLWNIHDKVLCNSKSSTLTDKEEITGSVVLTGHNSRIWDLSYSSSANLLASGSGDASVRIWKLNQYLNDNTKQPECVKVFYDENLRRKGDIYSVKFHQDGTLLITGSYDGSVCLYDVETGTLLKRFKGHTSSVCSVTFSDVLGNMIITGSKDHTIKFWDLSSGECVQTLTQHLGEITSVDVMKNHTGNLLLSCSKDNSNRLWDMRKNSEYIQRYKGHQNTNTNLIRAHFGPQNEVVVGGSEDGCTYLWDLNSGNILNKLKTSDGVVYESRWNPTYEVLVSCSNDSNVKCFLQG
jgi:COMPASS component SWD3